jgi:predicted DNA-binding transcriptional regulator AlpA
MTDADIFIDNAEGEAPVVSSLIPTEINLQRAKQQQGYHSPTGFDFSVDDMARINRACIEAEKFMRKICGLKQCSQQQSKQPDNEAHLTKQGLKRIEFIDKINKNHDRLQEKFEQECRLFKDGLSYNEVQDILGCSKQKIYELIRQGKFKRHRAIRGRGGAYIYDTESVFRYLYKQVYNFTPKHK